MTREIPATTTFHSENRIFLLLFSQLNVANLAHFGGLSVLTLYLAAGHPLLETSLLLAAMTTGLRGSRAWSILILHRLTARWVIPATTLVSGLGYLGLMAAGSLTQTALCLLVIGLGYGTGSMLVTMRISETAREPGKRFAMYALMNVGANLAASVAPILFNILRMHLSPQAPFAVAALILGVSLVISLRIAQQATTIQPAPVTCRNVITLLKTPRHLGVMAFIALGWAITTQKISATPLYVAMVLDKPQYVGLAVALPSIMALFLALPVGGFLRVNGIRSVTVLCASFTFYALGYGIIALMPSLAGLWLGLILCALGEVLLLPQLNMLIAEHTAPQDQTAGFVTAAIAVAAGEITGNVLGILLMSAVLTAAGTGTAYGALAAASVFALGCAALLTFKERPAHGH